MLGSSVKKLIIVTGEKEVVYAELLSSLISLKDDDSESNTVVGIKDGSVEAVVWTEKVYNDNKVQLGSNTKIVFVGKNKSSEAFIPSIRFNKELDKFGVKVGWLSNKAAIYADSGTLMNNKELYDEFYENYVELTGLFDDSVADSEALKKAKLTDGIDVAFNKGARAVGGFIGGIFGKKQSSEEKKAEGTDFFDFGAKAEANSLVPDQMFRYAILSFYQNGLADFMEIK